MKGGVGEVTVKHVDRRRRRRRRRSRWRRRRWRRRRREKRNRGACYSPSMEKLKPSVDMGELAKYLKSRSCHKSTEGTRRQVGAKKLT
eukprot:702981-Hanusia_phi.AAC.2